MSEPTPHRFVEYTDGNPIPVVELESQAADSKPGYWVVTSHVVERDEDDEDDDDFDSGGELRSAAYRFDKMDEASVFATSRLRLGCAAFVFWGWRLPLMASPMRISLSGGGRPFEECHELANGQLLNAGEVVVDLEDEESEAEGDD